MITNGTDKRLDAIQAELREATLRAEQRDAAYQATIQTLTRQMVQMDSEISDRLAAFDARFARVEERLARLEERLGRMETLLADIARKLDA